MIGQATRPLCFNACNAGQRDHLVLYRHALARGWRGQLWAGLTGRSRRLLSLAEVSQACLIQARSSGGTRTVPIAQICGSEDRAADFDCDFNPLQEHTRDRWLGIAAALERGRALPPVALIQVSDRYFVRDGHHRISVARALGQQTIQATVEIWQVDKPATWEALTQAGRSEPVGSLAAAKVTRGSRPASVLGWLASLL